MQLYFKHKTYTPSDYMYVPGDFFCITDRMVHHCGFCEEYDIIEKIKKNEDGYFDFTKSLIDVGAEDGNYSMLLDFKENYCFEPNKHMCCLLYTNMYMRDKVCNTQVFNCGCGDKEEDVVFNGFAQEGSGIWNDSLPRKLDNSYNTMHKITIDSLNLTNIGLIKTDTEGFDLDVLNGAVETIKRNDYPPILFELWDIGSFGMTQEKHDEVSNFITELGYEILWYWGDHETHLAIKKKKVDNNKKYTILTYNIGGYEVIHEVENKSDICEYIYITDDTSITSNTWNVVYIEKDDTITPFKKCCELRYLDLWKYVHTDVVIRIDGSMRIVGDTDKLYNEFIKSDADIGLMFHPWRNLVIDEYQRWCEIRNYNFKQAHKCLQFITKELDWDVFNDKGLFQINIVIEKKNKEIEKLNKCVFEYITMLSENKNDVERLDQTIYSVLYQKKFSYIKPYMMDYNILKGQPFLWCWHGEEKPMKIDMTLDKWYLNNKEYNL